MRVDALGESGETISLTAQESHYVARVCRSRPGETLSATDGRGTIARLVVLDVGPIVSARIESVTRAAARRRAIAWCGAPEGNRADWLVEKFAEFGVSTFQPVETERASWDAGDAKLERWRRLSVAALRQSRGAWLMSIEPARPLAELLGSATAADSRWLADPRGGRLIPAPGDGFSIGAVGPAEGFTAPEQRLLREVGFRLICLAGSRLRAETAAVAWAAWWASGGA